MKKSICASYFIDESNKNHEADRHGKNRSYKATHKELVGDLQIAMEIALAYGSMSIIRL